jgi:hypothetical protein
MRRTLLAVGGLFALFVALSLQLKLAPRISSQVEMQVALPRAVQVMSGMGDRYLAANLAGFRALVASAETMTRDNYRIQAQVQSDAAWLNPAHEDNYYIAAAILPWNSEVDAAQYILQRAALARPFDWQPAFYFAFNELTFNKAPERAAEWLNRSAESTDDEMQRLQLKQLAAQWATKADDPRFAIRLHRAMAKETRYKAFASFLEKRALRLENLMTLSNAAERYRQIYGRVPSSLQELLSVKLLPAIPADPFGSPYAIASDGKAVVASVGNQ